MKTNGCTLIEVRAVKLKAAALLAHLPIVGLGITRFGEGYGLKVNLSASVADDKIPAEIEGVPIKMEVVGTIAKR